jgi:gamma-glutamylcyclotransferase (GGCT)/AIG2-like uncharacterized protein YtfP
LFERNMEQSKFNLFVYGSLREPHIFKSVSGCGFTASRSEVGDDMFFAEPALLAGYRRVSPDNVYFYAVKDDNATIEGFLIRDVPASTIAEIDKYEGKRYRRQTVYVNTAGGRVESQAYLVSRESMKKRFGDRFHVNLIHELWLRKRIEEFIARHTRPGEYTTDAQLERRADRELLATTERDLVITHYGVEPVSDYYLEHELDRPRPSIRYLYDDPQARKYFKSYVGLVIKQVLLNQLDERIQDQFRFELEHIRTSERYYKRSVSLLISLQMINSYGPSVDMIIKQALDTMPFDRHDLIDYIKYAARAADTLFDPRVVRFHLDRVRLNFRPGLVPLGAEIEMSNLAYATLEPLRSRESAADPIYNGFLYFYDFRLDVLSWKLGGYIDDHSGATDTARRIGFLEMAPGRLNVTGELSRPATADPWLLSQLISALVAFYGVRPHSLHLSFQLCRRQIGKQGHLPLGFAKCLLALGGGLETGTDGRLWISRMAHDEIKNYRFGEELVFARRSRRKWYLGEDEVGSRPPAQATTSIQQYKFIRLEQRANYEPLILCLKGLQLSINPGDYITAEQLAGDVHLRNQYAELKQWAAEPSEISGSTIKRFIATVQEGLMNEAHHRPAHGLHYIDWALSALDVQLRMFNKQVKASPRIS